MSKHTFSVVLNSKEHVRNLSLSENINERVFIEGELGEFIRLDLVEDVLLEIQGENGILRVEIPEGALRKPGSRNAT